MKYKASLTFLLICLALTSFSKNAYDNVKIGIVTVSPGTAYFEAFGHSAIRVKSDDYDQTFGFGYFNFEDEDFLLNFAQGKMTYYLGVQDSDYEIQRYQDQGRKVTVQWLSLNSEQKKSLVQELSFLSRPENRSYQYDYFENNCTSRIRDLIDTRLPQSKHKSLNTSLKHSLYQNIFPVSNQAWLNLGFAIGFGHPAYQIKNQWQLLVFPDNYMQSLSNQNNKLNLIESESIWYQPSLAEQSIHSHSFWATHYALILVSLILVILFLVFRKKMWIHKFWLILNGFIGLILLTLWIFTEHKVAVWNYNLLLFMPFMLLLSRFKTKWFKYLALTSLLIWLGFALYFQNIYLLSFFLITFYSVLKISKSSENIFNK